ncbi:MAG: hypothetical protein ACJ79G_07525 [Myxococcales bacterium]
MIGATAWFWIIFRVIHIISAMLWLGSSFALSFFVEPSVDDLGSEGQRFWDHLVSRRKLPIAVTAVATLTVIGGAALYLKDSGGLTGDWLDTPTGGIISTGAIFGLVAYVSGIAFIVPVVRRLDRIAAAVASAGGTATSEQEAERARLTKRFRRLGRIDFALLVAAAISMETAGYW